MAAPAPRSLPRPSVVHGFLLLGLVITGAVFGYLLYGGRGPLLSGGGDPDPLGLIVAGVGLVLVAVGVAILRPRVPPRPATVTEEAYWAEPDHFKAALLLWMVLEQGGFAGLVGWLLTGSLASALAALAAVGALVVFQPAQLAGR